MTKNKPNLKLFTKTWPPRRKEKGDKNDERERPLTATLEKPQILDIKFIGKIDMSLIRKEFLCITNLCRAPLQLTKVSKKLVSTNGRRNVTNRPLSLPSFDNFDERVRISRRKKRPETHSEDSWGEQDSEVSQAQSARSTSRISKMKKITSSSVLAGKRQVIRRQEKKQPNDSNNNQKLTKLVPKTDAPNSNAIADGKKLVSTKLPQPCKTCGRPDQPERFHSHPATPLKPLKKMTETVEIPVKSSVQKPFAIKYQSKQSANDTKIYKKSTLPAQKIVHSPVSAADINKNNSTNVERPKTGRGKISLMCYLCGREFGTASLPLHEPKCLEKWQRENANLPVNLRRELPKKPDVPMTAEKWNEYAWEASQASLAPCTICGRTFLPDRLLVHQRSCKPQFGPPVSRNF